MPSLHLGVTLKVRGCPPTRWMMDRSRGTIGREAMKLLLIEDDSSAARVLAEALTEDGHETTIRHTGEDGLTYLTRERPDAVVLDVRLPAMSGVAVLRQIRATDPVLPVMMITGLATPEEIAEARRLGVTELSEKRG